MEQILQRRNVAHSQIPIIMVLRIKQILTCIQTDMHDRDGHIRIWCILEFFPLADTPLQSAVM